MSRSAGCGAVALTIMSSRALTFVFHGRLAYERLLTMGAEIIPAEILEARTPAAPE